MTYILHRSLYEISIGLKRELNLGRHSYIPYLAYRSRTRAITFRQYIVWHDVHGRDELGALHRMDTAGVYIFAIR